MTDDRPRVANLSDVAEAAGVSRTTVSNAYNRPDQLTAAVRERVLAIARSMNYPGPDPNARSLRTRRSDAVGLLFFEPLDFAFRDPSAVLFLEGVSARCEEMGRSLLLVSANSRSGQHATISRAAADGFVIYNMPPNDEHVAAVLARTQPAVVVDSPTGLASTDFIGIDEYAAMKSLTEHLLSVGHRRIAVAASRPARSAPDDDVPAKKGADSEVDGRRLAGIEDGLAERGLPAPLVQMIERDGPPLEAGARAAAAILAGMPDVTAIIALSDVLGVGALNELRRRGLDVPGDITVTGFDDSRLSATVDLTTVHQPLVQKGRLAIELLLLERSQVDVAPREVILPTELIVRSTVGPPRVRDVPA